MLASVSRKANGVARGCTGSFTGDGTPVELNLGFVPNRLVLINVTDAIKHEKINGMTAAQHLQTLAAGTQSVVATSQIVFNSNGTVSIAAATAPNAKVCVWYAD